MIDDDAKYDMKKLRMWINELIQERRPDRYTIGGTVGDDESDTQWLEDIAAEIEPRIPESEATTILARNLVIQEEGKATRRANQLLRKFGHSGQLPLFWMEDRDWPISVVSRSPEDPTKKIEERVALRAVSTYDARLFANEERRRSAKDFAARNEACIGAEMAADGAESLGLLLIVDYFITLEHPEEDEG